MLKTFYALDYTEMFAPGTERALVTLTYPGDWRTVVPNGEVAAHHLDELFRRFKNTFGDVPMVLWAREFMESGAPHFHLLLQIPQGRVGTYHHEKYERKRSDWEAGLREKKPRRTKPAHAGLTFEQWVRKTWAEIVDHPDSAERAKHEVHGVDMRRWVSDTPKHAVAYFSKVLSPSASYQQKVPEMWLNSNEPIGRSWGRRGLYRAVASVQISRRELVEIARIVRRKKRQVRYWDRETGEHDFRTALKRTRRPRGPVLGCETDENGIVVPVQKQRWTRGRRRFVSHTGAGTVFVDNGPEFARFLYRYLVAKTSPKASVDQLPVGMRGPVQERVTRRERGARQPQDLRVA